MTRVLLIDDNPMHRKIVADALSHGGFTVEQAGDGASGLKLLYQTRPDLVLLDVMMPAMDGWTVCQRIRELSDVPIIMLTSLNREEEMIRGLELGADDFVSKPVSPGHLVARVRAVLRRGRVQPTTSQPARYDDGELMIDLEKHEVRVNGERVDMTPTEFRLLAALAAAPDRVHRHSDLLTTVWGPEYVDDVDFLRVYIWRLRKKLEPSPGKPKWLVTERGFGYRLLPGGSDGEAVGAAD